MICPTCNTESEGAYCAQCGAPLEGAACRSCEAALVAGARYCTQCGEPVRPPAQKLPWYLTGASLAALIVVLLAPTLRSADEGAGGTAPFFSGAAPAAGPASGGGSPPPLTGTPREQADRLFNRIMRAEAAGNTEEVSFFMPMAVAAYQQAEPLDADGLFHLSLLQSVGGDPAAARATAECILAEEPTHLLALAVAADAADAAGDAEAAGSYYQRFLDAYEAERSRERPAYEHHGRLLPEYRARAEAFLAR